MSDLKVEIQTLKVALIGIDGQNGLRGEMRNFMAGITERMKVQEEEQARTEAWQAEVERRFDEYLRHVRQETCIGRAALDKYVAEIQSTKEDQEAEGKAATARAQAMKNDMKKTRWTVMGSVIVAVIMVGIPAIIQILLEKGAVQ